MPIKQIPEEMSIKMIILESITNCHTKALPPCYTDYSCHTERSEVSKTL